MDVLEFARTVEKSGDKEKVSCADRLGEFIANQVVYFGAHAAELPQTLRDQYFSVLKSALKTVPSGYTINISDSLRKQLLEMAPARELLAEITAWNGNGARSVDGDGVQ
ncbi:MAG: hypothetical protein ACREXK_14395 [Gammaproteobacteria bacterium]